MHHIDENPANNDSQNLLPLCPNCHLRDQHNPTRKIDIPRLKLFREFRDPAILKPQFHPLYLKQLFLDSIEEREWPINMLRDQAEELTDFVAALEMGAFYSKRLKEIFYVSDRHYEITEDGRVVHYTNEQLLEQAKEYRGTLVLHRNVVKALLIEMLRFQPWAN